jgi:hypothetical protein
VFAPSLVVPVFLLLNSPWCLRGAYSVQGAAHHIWFRNYPVGGRFIFRLDDVVIVLPFGAGMVAEPLPDTSDLQGPPAYRTGRVSIAA